MSCEKVLVFSAAVRGFHVYSDIWEPKENEQLSCSHEKQNLFDMFAIKTCRSSDNKTVGHLPREISRATKYLFDRGAKITATLSSSHYRRSPLFQGGLEIPCSVKVCLPDNIKGDMLIGKYKEIIEKLCIEPKDEVIVGCFLKKSGNTDESSIILPPPKRKKKDVSTKQPQSKGYSSKDIRKCFQRKENDNIEQNEKAKKTQEKKKVLLLSL